MTIILIAICSLVSLIGFRDQAFFQRFSFWMAPLQHQQQQYRLITSGFLHVDFAHLAFNMFSLYIFGEELEWALGYIQYSLLAIVSLLGGNLVSLWIHRNNPHYRAVGASGMVSGLIFSAIILFPNIRLGIIFLPIFIPGWIFGLLFVGISIFGMQAQRDNIGHEAHLGGAIAGLLYTLAIRPEAALAHWPQVLLLLIPSLVLFYGAVFQPPWFTQMKNRSKRF